MKELFDSEIIEFLKLCNEYNVRMLMVGGGAVNLHGYQRHSADVDFWIEPTEININRLIPVMKEMGYEIESFPERVIKGKQNISFKFSPDSFTVELITHYSSILEFDKAWERSETHTLGPNKVNRFRVIGLKDLIDTKLKAGRPKDLNDVQMLKELNKDNFN